MKQLSSMIVGFACSGSSTPPMPTPPDRWTLLADLRARADRRPRVDHRAFVDVRADVHVRRHQHDVPRDVGAAPRDGGRHDAHAGRREVGVVEYCANLRRHLVVEARTARVRPATDRIGRVVGEPERQQHRLLDPLVRRPRAVRPSPRRARARRRARRSRARPRRAAARRRVAGGERRARFPRLVDRRCEVVHGRMDGRQAGAKAEFYRAAGERPGRRQRVKVGAGTGSDKRRRRATST